MKNNHALYGFTISSIKTIAPAVAAFSLIAPAQAAVMFSENFNSNTLGANFYGVENSVTTSGGNVGFGGQSSYSGVNTVGTDYHLTDFRAQISVTVALGAVNNQLFFGMGRGLTTPDPGTNFGNPASGPMIYIRHYQMAGGNPINNLTIAMNDENSGGLGASEVLNQSGVGPGFGTYTLQMENIAGMVQFSVNNVAYGPAYDVSSYDFTGQGHIFMGGGEDFEGSITFDNFSVVAVPEPTSALLLLGSGAMLLRRRRRAATQASHSEV